MIKYKYFIDFEKEEKWLTDMASQGYRLKKAGQFYYTFEPIPPEQAVIRVDYRYFNWDDDFVTYCTMFEDSGWEHISGKKRSGFQYFKRKSECNDEHIYSDTESRAERYSRWLANPTLTFSLFLLLAFILERLDLAYTFPVFVGYVMIAALAGLIIFEAAREIKIRSLRKKQRNSRVC